MHISVSPTKGSTTFSPIGESYVRVGKDGEIPVINFLVGSQYSISLDGEVSITSTGSITNDTVETNDSKLEITSTASGEVQKIATFTSFMYFYPGIRIVGHSEIEDSNVGSNPVPIQRIRYEYEDLATSNKILVDLEGGDGNAKLILREVVGVTVTDLATYKLTAGETEIKWELDFLQDGVTKFWYKENDGDKTRLFNGDIKADIGEAKCSIRMISDQSSSKTVKSDYMFIFYPNLHINYDIPDLTTKTKGRVRIFDTNKEDSEDDWTEVFSGDHTFKGERVVENGFIRIHFKPSPQMQVLGWNTDSNEWQSVGYVSPKSNGGDLSNTLHDIIFPIFNDSHVKVIVKYGIVDHIVDIRRGNPYARIFMNSKEFRFTTSKHKFVTSTKQSSHLPNFNQFNTKDDDRGNPLALSSSTSIYVFTDNTDTDTGLDLLNDNWYAFYDKGESEMVGWIANIAAPTKLSVSAISETELEHIDLSYEIENNIISVGILQSNTNSFINDIPKAFNVGDVDTYVKWRAIESIMGFNQRPYMRKKR